MFNILHQATPRNTKIQNVQNRFRDTYYTKNMFNILLEEVWSQLSKIRTEI